jgi:hypothetical protein
MIGTLSVSGLRQLLQSRGSLWYHPGADLTMQTARVAPGETRNFPEIEPGFFVDQCPALWRDRSDFVSFYG